MEKFVEIHLNSTQTMLCRHVHVVQCARLRQSMCGIHTNTYRLFNSVSSAHNYKQFVSGCVILNGQNLHLSSLDKEANVVNLNIVEFKI